VTEIETVDLVYLGTTKAKARNVGQAGKKGNGILLSFWLQHVHLIPEHVNPLQGWVIIVNGDNHPQKSRHLSEFWLQDPAQYHIQYAPG